MNRKITALVMIFTSCRSDLFIKNTEVRLGKDGDLYLCNKYQEGIKDENIWIRI